MAEVDKEYPPAQLGWFDVTFDSWLKPVVTMACTKRCLQAERQSRTHFCLQIFYSRLVWFLMNELLDLAKAGDSEAEEQLFESLFVRFKLFAIRQLGSSMEADEVAQRACLTVHSKYKSELFTVSFEAWAYGVFKKTLQSYQRDTARKDNRNVKGDEMDSLATRESSEPLYAVHLRECLVEIKKSFPRYMRILNLHYHGYQPAEICSRLNLNIDQFYVYLSRGRSLLKECHKRRREVVSL